jgi:hypothetical protein
LAATANDPDGRAISADSSAKHPWHSTLQVLEDPAPPTSEGSPTADPAPAPAMSGGSPSPTTSKDSPAPATSEGSPTLAPDDPLHNPVISTPSNTYEKRGRMLNIPFTIIDSI